MSEQATQSNEVECVDLKLSDDNLFLYAKVHPETIDPDKLLDELGSKMIALGISETQHIEDAHARLTGYLSRNLDRDSYVVLEGTPVIPGEDGRIEWARDFFDKGFKVDPETGQVDYRQRSVDMTVLKGDLLAEILPPKEGQDGVDLFGNTIPAGTGKPAELKVGPNARTEGSRFFSEIDGRIKYFNGVLAVDDLFLVPGSVNLEVGNINHPGALVVQENVEPQANVQAAGDIEIAGYVEDANVTAGGDLHVGGGVFGKSGNTIKVSGELHAKFLGNAVVECEGDVVVEKYIDNCRIFTRGKLRVPTGRIVGGEIVALGGITVGEAGSDACVATQLIAGEDYKLRELLQPKQEEEEKLRGELSRIEEGLKKVRDKVALLGDKAKEAVTALESQSAEMGRRLTELETEIENLTGASKEVARNEIVVLGRIFPGASFTVAGCLKAVQDEVRGPVKLIIRDGDITIVVKNS